jgi:hypothetical protein
MGMIHALNLAAFDLNLLLVFRAMMAERHRLETAAVSEPLWTIPRLGEGKDCGLARGEPGAVAAVREGLGEHFRLTPYLLPERPSALDGENVPLSAARRCSKVREQKVELFKTLALISGQTHPTGHNSGRVRGQNTRRPKGLTRETTTMTTRILSILLSGTLLVSTLAVTASAQQGKKGQGATPAVPATPAIPATPGSKSGPAIKATPATPATPALPPSPVRPPQK